MNANYSEALEQQLALKRWLHDERNWIARDRIALAERANMTGSRFPLDGSLRAYALQVLDSGEPYFWGRGPSDVLERTAPYFPDWTLDEALMPTRTGFVWFERPLRLPTVNGTDARLAALGWCPSPHNQHLILTFFWNVGQWSGVPMAYTGWTWGRSWHATKAGYEKVGTPDGQTSRQRVMRGLEYFGAGLAFLNQKLMTAEPLPARSRLRRASHEANRVQTEPTIRVVQLRRSERVTRMGMADHPVHEWHSQWIVRGHWRQQACGPKLERRMPRWILPYIKGPEDKPLKTPRPTVFAVVR